MKTQIIIRIAKLSSWGLGTFMLCETLLWKSTRLKMCEWCISLMIFRLCQTATDWNPEPSNWLSNLEKTEWLSFIKLLLWSIITYLLHNSYLTKALSKLRTLWMLRTHLFFCIVRVCSEAIWHSSEWWVLRWVGSNYSAFGTCTVDVRSVLSNTERIWSIILLSTKYPWHVDFDWERVAKFWT